MIGDFVKELRNATAQRVVNDRVGQMLQGCSGAWRVGLQEGRCKGEIVEGLLVYLREFKSAMVCKEITEIVNRLRTCYSQPSDSI